MSPQPLRGRAGTGRVWRAVAAAAAGCYASPLEPVRPRGLLPMRVRGPQATGRALNPICPTSGPFPRLLKPSGSPHPPLPHTPRQGPDSLLRGSGREGGVSGAGGREQYKSAGGAPAGVSFAASRRDRERRGKHGPWRGRCARATQCVDYLQPLPVQYAGAPEQLNGVATPLPGLDHSAAFPYEEDTSE